MNKMLILVDGGGHLLVSDRKSDFLQNWYP